MFSCCKDASVNLAQGSGRLRQGANRIGDNEARSCLTSSSVKWETKRSVPPQLGGTLSWSAGFPYTQSMLGGGRLISRALLGVLAVVLVAEIRAEMRLRFRARDLDR